MSNQQYPYPPQQPYGGQPYGQPHPYGSQAPERRSPVLGYIGLGLVVVSGLALIIAAAVLGSAFGDFMRTIGPEIETIDEQTLAQDPRFVEFLEQTGMLWLLVQFMPGLGFIGWIISIVAVATRRGRGPGIWGIVLGVIAPLAALVLGLTTMWPAITAMVS